MLKPVDAQALQTFLVRNALARADEPSRWTALAGGVSSDIWRVDLPGRSICVKRALSALKVAADWRAPVSRNAYEYAWIQFAARRCPDNAPRPLAHDPEAGLFAMTFLAPENHPVWKQQLMAGLISASAARDVGDLLGRLHQASAGSLELASRFDTTISFRALRLDPYLAATALRHPDVAPQLRRLFERTEQTRKALVHGDVSPKNILVGPRGPVLLDAECAWFGDPAFDLAFCLNHLLLKCLPQPEHADELLGAGAALIEAYFQHVDWEPPVALEERAATLLPALLLARIDGKSPVEYITEKRQKDLVRGFSLRYLQEPPVGLRALADAWREALLLQARAHGDSA